MVPYDSADNYYNDRPTTHCIVCGKKLQLSNEFDKCTNCAYAPMKVIKEVDKKYVDTHDFYERDIYKCGSCKKVLTVDRYQRLQDDEKTNYCHFCGQRLNWDEL